jgi:hypothetical protein
MGPWLAFPFGTLAITSAHTFVADDGIGLLGAFGAPVAIGRPAPARSSGCTCREVDVEATNIVRDADVRTGDAKVVNRSITYVTPTYGDDDVDVDQRADARSGDAVAGQILGVSAAGRGCARIHVHATNDVRDVDVRSGDAIARNESIVLLDPRIDPGDLDIDVDQDARARSGDAIAGQVIGIRGGGGPCGGVVLDAINRVRGADVRTGDAKALNSSEILSCADPSCLKEIRRVLDDLVTVTVCESDDCRPVAVADFVRMLKESFLESETVGDAETTEDESGQPTTSPSPSPLPIPMLTHHRRHHHHGPGASVVTEPTPAPSPAPQPQAAPV